MEKKALSTNKVELQFKKVTPSGSTASITDMYNNSNKGVTNNFLSYFKLVTDANKYYLAVRDDLTDEQKSLINSGTIPSKDLVGWVKYDSYNVAGDHTTGTVKITVKFNK